MARTTVHALQAGHLTMPSSSFIHSCSPTSTRYVPSFSFLITHTPSTTSRTIRILFDLGLRRISTSYPSGIQTHMQKRQPYDISRNILTSLASLRLTPDDIDYVILSHVHWDHVGMPSDFGRSVFVVGPGSESVLRGETRQVGSHAVFERDLLPEGRWVELSDPQAVMGETGGGGSEKVGEFSMRRNWEPAEGGLGDVLGETLDLFGDGMARIVNGPGHLQGHINLLVRTGHGNDGKYAYLAGDACHNRRLLTGEKQIAEWDVDGEPHCIHVNKEAAKKTIQKIAAVEKLGVEVVFAHDVGWEEQEVQKGTDSRLVG